MVTIFLIAVAFKGFGVTTAIAAGAVVGDSNSASKQVVSSGVPIPVPTVVIYPGAPIGNDQLTDKLFRHSITRAAVHQTRVSVIGKVARRVLLPGKPIPVVALKEAEAVEAGQAVAVIYSAEGIEIVGRAVPLQSGKVGDIVPVRNLDSGLVVRAVVNSDGTVRVGPE